MPCDHELALSAMGKMERNRPELHLGRMHVTAPGQKLRRDQVSRNSLRAHG